MGVTRKHTIYGASLGSTLIGGVTQQQIRTGTSVVGERSSGDVYARFQAVTAQSPGATFSTRSLAAALNVLTVLGAKISGLTGGVALYAQAHTAGGTRAGATSHRKYAFAEGLVVPRRLTCEHGGDAVLEVDVVAIHDGTNAPLIVTDSVTLPSGLADTERFTLGPIEIESVTVAQVRSLEIDFGLEVVAEASDSDLYPTFVSLESVQPSLTVRGIDVELLKAGNIPITGKAATHTNTAIYLRKRAQGGTFVADATSEHIKFTAAGLAYIDDAFNGSVGQAGETGLMMPLRFDGTNAPLVMDTTAALP